MAVLLVNLLYLYDAFSTTNKGLVVCMYFSSVRDNTALQASYIFPLFILLTKVQTPPFYCSFIKFNHEVLYIIYGFLNIYKFQSRRRTKHNER